jgi:hypothetical protein
LFYAYSRFLKHLSGQFILVTVTDNDTDNTRVDYHFGANNTGMISAIQRRSFGIDPMQRRLNNGVLFRVKSTA